jgi:AmmeMemoRadiSam system protein B
MFTHVRKPSVAGKFYADTPGELSEQIEWCYRHRLGPGTLPIVAKEGPRNIVSLVIPHAGYMCSGPIAAHAYKELAADGIVDTAIILSPNHTGYGPPVSIWARNAWVTPLGEMSVNEEVAQSLVGGIVQADETAHLYEHSIEVQLPWLQHLYGKVRFVPITMMAQDIETAREVGKAISSYADSCIIIASTDFTHYEPHAIAVKKDRAVIEAIEALDEEELYRRLNNLNCTMCGYGPVAVAIVANKEVSAQKSSLLKYATSGDVLGDYSSVVGYASMVIKR